MTTDIRRRGGRHLQETKTESHGQSNLLGLLKLKLPDLANGKKQDDKVGEEGRCGVGDPRADLVNATAWEMRIPELLHGDADEYKEKRDAHDPRHHESSHNPCRGFEVRDAEDAVVHEQHGKLRPAQVEGVENLGHDEPFRHADDIFRVDEVGVDAHPVGIHGEDESHYREVPALAWCLLVSGVGEDQKGCAYVWYREVVHTMEKRIIQSSHHSF